MRLNVLTIAAALGIAAMPAQATFFIDYQGLDTEPEIIIGPPDGFKVFADGTFKVLSEVGEGQADIRLGYGLEIDLDESMLMIMPDDWIAYIDEQINFERKVDWTGDMPWTDVLLRLGNAYGLAFIVDWEQKMVQIVPGNEVEYFTLEDMQAHEVVHPVTGATLYIHTADQLSETGLLMVDGKHYRVEPR